MADIRHIKQISIRYYLAERSLYPTKDNPRYGLYLSPLREEHTPSFKVDYEQNLWYDFGLGEGGSIIDLVMCMELCDAGEAIQRLDRRDVRFYFLTKKSCPEAFFLNYRRESAAVGKFRIA